MNEEAAWWLPGGCRSGLDGYIFHCNYCSATTPSLRFFKAEICHAFFLCFSVICLVIRWSLTVLGLIQRLSNDLGEQWRSYMLKLIIFHLSKAVLNSCYRRTMKIPHHREDMKIFYTREAPTSTSFTYLSQILRNFIDFFPLKSKSNKCEK